MAGALLIRRAELQDGRIADVRLGDGRIAAIGALPPEPGEQVIEARGGLLLPGLHDHHIHIAALAAASASVSCGPPDVTDEAALHAALARRGTGWLRGIGYHESVAGPIDRSWLDRAVPRRPARIQHRSGRLWILNSRALDTLLAQAAAPPGLDRATGHLFDEDGWLRAALGSTPPGFVEIGALLARHGVTGITDMTPANDAAMAAHFAAEHHRGALPQRIVLAGKAELGHCARDAAVTLGPVKLHLHEANLPPYDDMVGAIRAAHHAGRAAAVHCVSEVELVFCLAALREAGTLPGDRIEHASVAPPDAVAEIAALGIAIVTQPNFVAERGDAYRAEIAPADWPNLYRLRSWHDHGVVLAAGTDAPFGRPDPWAAMRAAISRRTAHGALLGAQEALTPEAALALFLTDPRRLGHQRRVAVGQAADLCLLTLPWRQARLQLGADLVRATLIAGLLVHDGIDQPPGERSTRIYPPAGQHQLGGTLAPDPAGHRNAAAEARQ